MRCFLAISLPANISDYLFDLTQRWQAQNQKIQLKWVEKENLHLTLQFWGEISLNNINQLDKSLREQVSFAPFSLSLDNLSVFPNYNDPRVLKCSLFDPRRKLIELYEKIKRAADELSAAADNKQFSSHITLGRIKFIPNSAGINNPDVEKMAFPVCRFKLIESALTETGPVYNTLFQYDATE